MFGRPYMFIKFFSLYCLSPSVHPPPPDIQSTEIVENVCLAFIATFGPKHIHREEGGPAQAFCCNRQLMVQVTDCSCTSGAAENPYASSREREDLHRGVPGGLTSWLLPSMPNQS
jgi:hypothetical protein